MLSGDFLLCQTFWSKYLWTFLAIYVDYSYFDAQVRCTYLVPNMTLTLMFNRNYNNLRYSIKKIKSLLEQKFFFVNFPKNIDYKNYKLTPWNISMSNAEPTCQDGFSNFKIIFLKI